MLLWFFMFAIYIDLCFIYNIFISSHIHTPTHTRRHSDTHVACGRRLLAVKCNLLFTSFFSFRFRFALSRFACSVAKTLLKLFLFIYRLCVFWLNRENRPNPERTQHSKGQLSGTVSMASNIHPPQPPRVHSELLCSFCSGNSLSFAVYFMCWHFPHISYKLSTP